MGTLCVDAIRMDELNSYEDLRMWEGNDAVCRANVALFEVVQIECE